MATATNDSQDMSVDAIIQEGLAGSGVGASTNVPTASTPPIPGVGNPVAGANTQTGRGLGGFDVEQPSWGFRPTQQDFGQVDVRRGQHDTGMVPTVQTQIPFSAFASRQQALEQKKAALAQKMAAYDPYAGIGKAHDRYQTAFNRYAVNYINEKRQGIADSMFGGDMALADKYLGTDPQGRAMLAQWGSEMQALGSENKAWTDSFIDLTSRVASGETYVPPEYMNEIMQFGSALGNDGLPVQGMEVSEFLPKGRNAEGRLREIQYVDEIVTPGLKNALKTTTGIDIGNRRKGGKIVMTEREEKTFDDALKYFVNSEDGQDFVELYHGGDKDKAFAALKSFFPTSVKEDVTLTSPYSPNKGNSGNESKVWLGGIETAPDKSIEDISGSFETFTPDGPSAYQLRPSDSKIARKPVGKVVSGVNVNMGPLKFSDAAGEPVKMEPRYITMDSNGTMYVEGDVVGDQETVTVETMQKGRDGKMQKVQKTINTQKENKTITLPVDNQPATMDRYFGPGWREGFGDPSRLKAQPEGKRNKTADAKPDMPQNGEKRSDGAVYNASLGGWYKKVGDEYVNVQ